MTIAPPNSSRTRPDSSAIRQWLAVATLIAALTALRVIYASVIDLRTDEAYYWTWSKESVLSFLDHPPMIAWFIRFGTAIFGDTNLGVRFAGILAMLATQLLLADIARFPDALFCSATDANGPGDRFADRYQSLAKEFGVPFVRVRPPIESGDWNEALHARATAINGKLGR